MPNGTDASGRCVDNMVLGNLSGRFLLGNRGIALSQLAENVTISQLTFAYQLPQSHSEFSRIIPFRFPTRSEELPQWIKTQTDRICNQLCNRDHTDNVFQHLNRPCSNEANQVCDYLCADTPQNPDLESDYDHSGLLLRWMLYFIDHNNKRHTHKFAYEQVQRFLRDFIDPENGNDFDGMNGCGGPIAPHAVRELATEARKWVEQELQIPFRDQDQLNYPNLCHTIPFLCPDIAVPLMAFGGSLLLFGYLSFGGGGGGRPNFQH